MAKRNGTKSINVSWKRLYNILCKTMLDPEFRIFLRGGEVAIKKSYINQVTIYKLVGTVPEEDYELYNSLLLKFARATKERAKNVPIERARKGYNRETVQLGRPKGISGRGAATWRRKEAKLERLCTKARVKVEEAREKGQKRLDSMSDNELLLREQALRRQGVIQ